MNLKNKVSKKSSNGIYENHNNIIEVFREAFKGESSIAKKYRLRLNDPRSEERIRISMGGGAGRVVAEINGLCVLIKERKAYYIFMQDKNISEMFNYLKKFKRLNGGG